MKLIREHINEKFVEDEYSDPVYDMGIGMIHNFKNIMKLVGKADKQRYIYTIVPCQDFMDFWFYRRNNMNVSHRKDARFNYVLNIIKKLGFDYCLFDPILIECYYKDVQLKLPKIVRFKVRSAYQYKFKEGEYRRSISQYKISEKMENDEFVFNSHINIKDYKQNANKTNDPD
jgi:hypothetical protein